MEFIEYQEFYSFFVDLLLFQVVFKNVFSFFPYLTVCPCFGTRLTLSIILCSFWTFCPSFMDILSRVYEHFVTVLWHFDVLLWTCCRSSMGILSLFYGHFVAALWIFGRGFMDIFPLFQYVRRGRQRLDRPARNDQNRNK